MKLRNYGIPYMGCKSFIAKDIMEVLPNGNRFVDLFGGGGAMSHYALLSNKYNKVYYNELNPLLEPLINDIIDGKFNYDIFKPRFITREEFFEKKESDGYIKYMWSFGNQGKSYIFGKQIEKFKEALHNAIIFDNMEPLQKMFPSFNGFNSKDIKDRIKEWKRFIIDNNFKLEQYSSGHLYQCQHLQRIHRLQSIHSSIRERVDLNNFEINTGNYLDYVYQDGDVVYCDPPYENTGGYDTQAFNHQEFYDWVASRPYQVYFSSFEISDNRFHKTLIKLARNMLKGGKNTLYNNEYLYSNKSIIISD